MITAVTNGSDFATSGNEIIPTLDVIERQMREPSGVVDAIHFYEPETACQMYAYMRQALVAGIPQETIRSEIQRQTAEAIVRAYPKADDDLFMDFAQLLGISFGPARRSELQ